MKKTTLIIGGIIVVIVIVALAIFLSGEKEEKPTPDNDRSGQEVSPDSGSASESGENEQKEGPTGEIVGQTDKNGIPIPKFSLMEEIMTEQKKGDSFEAVYNINRPEEEAIKNFYQDNLGDDWSLEKEQSSGDAVVYEFVKGDNYELEVALMADGAGKRLVLKYDAPYQEDPYPDAIGVEPTSEEAEKYHQDFSSIFEEIFGGSKLKNAHTGDWIKLEYVVKRPITQEDATEIRDQLEKKEYETINVSKEKNEAEYTFQKSYGDWNEPTVTIKVGEFIPDVQQIEVKVWE